jgi:hypothetical protein
VPSAYATDTSPPGNDRRAFNSTNGKGRTRDPALSGAGQQKTRWARHAGFRFSSGATFPKASELYGKIGPNSLWESIVMATS